MYTLLILIIFILYLLYKLRINTIENYQNNMTFYYPWYRDPYSIRLWLDIQNKQKIWNNAHNRGSKIYYM
jgi:hypothetical protein